MLEKFTLTYDGSDGTHMVDTSRPFGGYQPGDFICSCCPFFGVPLRLEIAIRANGSIAFRSWDWSGRGNHYLHTNERPGEFNPTPEQVLTVNGLFSGRITWEGLKLAPGQTLQELCPIDLAAEQERVGMIIYLR